MVKPICLSKQWVNGAVHLLIKQKVIWKKCREKYKLLKLLMFVRLFYILLICAKYMFYSGLFYKKVISSNFYASDTLRIALNITVDRKINEIRKKKRKKGVAPGRFRTCYTRSKLVY